MNDEQKKKIFLMRVSISFFVVLLLVFWILNFKHIWNFKSEGIISDKEEEWSDLKNNIGEAFSEIDSRIGKIEEAKKIMEDNNIEAQDLASSTLIQDLIQKTEELASSTASSTNSTTTAPALKNNSACPAYIDCMPTIGETRNCQIPVGCEGITQIAY